MHIKFLTAAITLPELKKPDAGEDMAEEVQRMLQELQQLHSFLDMSNLEVAKAEQLLKSLLSRKPKIEALLNQCIVPTEKEKGNTVCVDDEKIVLPSVAATDSESSNKATERKQPQPPQPKGKGKFNNSKKGKGKGKGKGKKK
uniref:Uncharacterized protein n=2 Tax=Solanum tuberosum TaxID=4113 RepID=M1AG62_SOLTU